PSGGPLPPPLHPATHEPIGPEALAPLFPMALIEQEVSTERFTDIPDEVREVYKLWRPTPLYRAHRLEKALDTPARIYYKYEGVSPAGSHKPNTAVAQAYYNKQAGIKRLATETGAGQWGSALAMACNIFDIELKVYMVKVSYHQKPYRRVMMETWGAQVVASPTGDSQAGRAILEQDPDSPGSLGIAISEASEDAATKDDTNYSLGSVLNHVLLHQTVVGQDFRQRGEYLFRDLFPHPASRRVVWRIDKGKIDRRIRLIEPLAEARFDIPRPDSGGVGDIAGVDVPPQPRQDRPIPLGEKAPPPAARQRLQPKCPRPAIQIQHRRTVQTPREHAEQRLFHHPGNGPGSAAGWGEQFPASH
ncbi:hypothetical protein LCGC14_2632590, partial [marine sediment metagenome]